MIRNKAFIALALCALLLPLPGCGSFEKNKKATALESTLYAYGNAIRWGYFETAYGFVHPSRRKPVPQHLKNVRVTSYDVAMPPLGGEKSKVEQIAQIEYVLEDEQLVRSLTDRQVWRYDAAAKTWWLHSEIPHFK